MLCYFIYAHKCIHFLLVRNNLNTIFYQIVLLVKNFSKKFLILFFFVIFVAQYLITYISE